MYGKLEFKDEDDANVVLSALSLFIIWMTEPGTLAMERGDIDEDQQAFLDRLSDLGITPDQLAIELKSKTKIRAHELKDILLDMIAARRREEDGDE